MKYYAIGDLILSSEQLPFQYQPFEVESGKNIMCRVEKIDKKPEPAKGSAPFDEECFFLVYPSTDGGWVYQTKEDEVRLKVSSDYKEIWTWTKEENSRTQESIAHLLRIAIECLMIKNHKISLHAACVEKGGEAVCFSGISGVGKSTRASKWKEALSANWVSGDRPAVDVKKGQVIGVPWDGKEQLFIPCEYPLKAICMVHRASFTSIRKLSKKQAKQILLKQCFIPMWDTELSVLALENLSYLVENVLCYNLFCNNQVSGAKETYLILNENKEQIRGEKEMYQLKDGFVIRNIAGEYMVIPSGANIAKFDGSVALNEISAFILEQMKNPLAEEDLLKLILEEYEVEKEIAEKDLKELIQRFTEFGVIEQV